MWLAVRGVSRVARVRGAWVRAATTQVASAAAGVAPQQPPSDANAVTAEDARSLIASAGVESADDVMAVLATLVRSERLDAVLMQSWQDAMLPHVVTLSASQASALVEAVSTSPVPPSPAFVLKVTERLELVMNEVSELWRVAAALRRLAFMPRSPSWWRAFDGRAAAEMSECPVLSEYLSDVATLGASGRQVPRFLNAWEETSTAQLMSFAAAEVVSRLPKAFAKLQHVPGEAFLNAWLSEAVVCLRRLFPWEQWKLVARVLVLPFDSTGEGLRELLAGWAASIDAMDLEKAKSADIVNMLVRLAQVKWTVPGTLSEKLLRELAERPWDDAVARAACELGRHLAFLLPRSRVASCARFFKAWGERTAPQLKVLTAALRTELMEMLAWMRVDAKVVGKEWFEAWFAVESVGLDASVLGACEGLEPDAKCAEIVGFVYLKAQVEPLCEVFRKCVSVDDPRVVRAVEDMRVLLEKHVQWWVPDQLVDVFCEAAKSKFVGFPLYKAWQQTAMQRFNDMRPGLLMHCLDAVGHCLPMPPSNEFMRAWVNATRRRLEFERKPWIVASLLSRLNFQPDDGWMREFAGIAAKNPGDAGGFVAYLMSVASIGAPLSTIRVFVDAWEAVAVERLTQFSDHELTRRIVGAYCRMRHLPGDAFLKKWQDVTLERLPRLSPEERWATMLKLLGLPWTDLSIPAPLVTRLLESVSPVEFGRQADDMFFVLLAKLQDWAFEPPSVWTERVVAELRRRVPTFPDSSLTFVANWATRSGPEELIAPLVRDLVKASEALLPSFVMYLLPSIFFAMERLGVRPESVGAEWFRAWLAAAGRHMEVKAEAEDLFGACRDAAVRMSEEVDEVIVGVALLEASENIAYHDRTKVKAAVQCMRVLLGTRHASFPAGVLSSAFCAAAKLRQIDEELLYVWEVAAQPRLGEMSGPELVSVLRGIVMSRPLTASHNFFDAWCVASAAKLDEVPDLWRVAHYLSFLSLSPDDAWWRSFALAAPRLLHKCDDLVAYLANVSNTFGVSLTVKPFLAAWEAAALPHLFTFTQLQIVRWIPGALERLRHVPSDAFLEVYLARALQTMQRLTLRERWVLGERIAHIPFETTGMASPFLDQWTRSFTRADLGNVDETPLMTVMACFEAMDYAPSVDWLRDVLLELTERMARFYSTKSLMNSLVLVSKLIAPAKLQSIEFRHFVKSWARESAPRLVGLSEFSLVSVLAAIVRVGATPETIGAEWFQAFLRAAGSDRSETDLVRACCKAGWRICPYVLENMRTIGAKDKRVLRDWIDAVLCLRPDDMMRRNQLARSLQHLEQLMDPEDIPTELVRMCKEAQAAVERQAQATWKPPPITMLPPLSAPPLVDAKQ
jgi:hypothetical protein